MGEGRGGELTIIFHVSKQFCSLSTLGTRALVNRWGTKMNKGRKREKRANVGINQRRISFFFPFPSCRPSISVVSEALAPMAFFIPELNITKARGYIYIQNDNTQLKCMCTIPACNESKNDQ